MGAVDTDVLTTRGTDRCRGCLGLPPQEFRCTWYGCRAEPRPGRHTCEEHRVAGSGDGHSCEVQDPVSGRWVPRSAAGQLRAMYDTSPEGRAARMRQLGITRRGDR